jgi:hypothetical protein
MKDVIAANTGRMIDYWLGGSDHSPADIQAAEALTAAAGTSPAILFRMLRAFTGRASRFIVSQGVSRFVVFGAGVPTRGNVHEAVPEARVVYTDIDETNVRRGRAILADCARTIYLHADAGDPSTVDIATITSFLGTGPIGFVYIGVAALLDDARIHTMLSALHAWSPPGSWLAFDFDGEAGTPHCSGDIHVARNAPPIEASLHFRAPDAFERLLGQWRLIVPGIVPVAAWRAAAEPIPATDPRRVFMYGGVATR